MVEPIPYATLEAIKAQLAVITTAGGYNTDIGARIRIDDAQRSDSELPSIAIGSTSGELDLTGENGSNGGGQKSPRERRMAITLEAAMAAALEQEHHVAHLMLEDIERALARDTRLLPPAARAVKFTTWSVLAREPGANAVVLQILGSADYVRSQT